MGGTNRADTGHFSEMMSLNEYQPVENDVEIVREI